MKKVFLSLIALICSCCIMTAQEVRSQAPISNRETAKATTTSLTAQNLAFETETHDFGTVEEGPAAEYIFKFKNTGKQPIILEKVQASCGCTTPSYSKDPILPGKEGEIKVSYNTQGRPNGFTKSITVTSNAGVKVLNIKGNVEKAPTGSVPENSSMVKTF